MEELDNPFTGTARYYAQYRLDYPKEMITLMRDTFGLDGRGRLLDVGCGTGKLTIPLCAHFDSIIAIDRDPEMLDELERQCRIRGISNITAVSSSAEDLTLADGAEFRMITCGDSFHWMNRDLLLKRWHRLITPDGGLAIVASGGGAMTYPVAWQQAVWEVIRRWLGNERRNSYWQKDERRHAQVIEMSGLYEIIATGHVEATYTRDVESVIGFLYSTSFCNRSLLGENVPEFEADLRQTLLNLEPAGLFLERVKADYIFAKPRS